MDNNQPITSPKFSRNYYIGEACRTASSLLSEGYVIRTKWYDEKRQVIMYTLRHMLNRNVITIHATSEKFLMLKNGRQIKKLP